MWTLLLSRLNDPPGSFFDRRQIDAGQIKVGRSEKSCDLILPDEQGFVSREHCTIAAMGLDLFVTDTSKNGVALNVPGQRIVPGQAVAIRPGDRLIVNDFVITVSTPADAMGAAFAAPPPPPLPLGGSTAGDDIWGAGPSDPFLGDLAGGDIHDFLSGGSFSPAPPPSGFAAAPSIDFGAPPPPLADFGFGTPFGEAFAPRPIMADPAPFGGSVGIPEDWASPGNGVGDGQPIPEFDPFPALDVPAAAPSGPGDAFAGEPFAGFGEAPAAPVAPAPQSPPSTLASSAPDAAGWAAFYEGAGFTPDEMKLPPDAMYRLGVLYRQVVLGLADIMQDRATFKDEFRVERTQLSMGRNNPLKHLPAFDAAKVVIGQPLPGFMDGEEAVRSSFEDIKKHQMAMLAGVQNALTTAFSRLAPAEMEKLVEAAQSQKKGFLGKRGIDRWSLYVTVYENLRKDATSNANGIMSSAFREGYEKFMKSTR
ncbi:type VI secretion system-associated FHA domain protein TagH [Novosphingobium resinovorum]|uniref:type VI secretion system-associated FHA domain protein TagH n=1 Tax=Novosphingobium resinovorum TaxID=158500 RepID=UPI002ED5DF1C|nr:type VI secretion system-associated FHA domain protein TagH [Novosphingobium resinovorum]